MKRLILTLMVTCITLCGCSLPFQEEEEKPVEKPKVEEEQIVAPYIGYAPIDDNMRATIEQAFPNEPNLEVFKYEAGDNNKATIRIEKMEKGKWKTVQEQSLMLIHNVRNGYLVFNGDTKKGMSFNTGLIENDNKQLKNFIRFKPEKYGSLVMFDKPKNGEGRIDLAEKHVLMIGYENEPLHTMNGNIVSTDQGEEANITDVYANKDGLFSKQKLMAVTAEFTYDELISKMPYFTRDGKKIKYESGLYTKAKISLNTLNDDFKWESIDEKEFPLDVFGEMKVNGSAKDGKISITLGGKKETFKIPKQDGFKYSCELNGISEPNVSAKNGLVLNISEQENITWANVEDKVSLKNVIESGLTADEAYDNRELITGEEGFLYALVMTVE